MTPEILPFKINLLVTRIRDFALSGSDIFTIDDPALRTYSATSAQRVVSFLCLDFYQKFLTYNLLPRTLCPSGICAQIISSLTTSPKHVIKYGI